MKEKTGCNWPAIYHYGVEIAMLIQVVQQAGLWATCQAAARTKIFAGFIRCTTSLKLALKTIRRSGAISARCKSALSNG